MNGKDESKQHRHFLMCNHRLAPYLTARPSGGYASQNLSGLHLLVEETKRGYARYTSLGHLK